MNERREVLQDFIKIQALLFCVAKRCRDGNAMSLLMQAEIAKEHVDEAVNEFSGKDA